MAVAASTAAKATVLNMRNGPPWFAGGPSPRKLKNSLTRSGRLHGHIAARRRLYCREPALAGHPRRHFLLAVGEDPALPVGPPASADLGRRPQPCLRGRRQRFAGPVAVFAALRRVHHARDMPARREHEPLLATKQLRAAIRALPGRDVVLAG